MTQTPASQALLRLSSFRALIADHEPGLRVTMEAGRYRRELVCFHDACSQLRQGAEQDWHQHFIDLLAPYGDQARRDRFAQVISEHHIVALDFDDDPEDPEARGFDLRCRAHPSESDWVEHLAHAFTNADVEHHNPAFDLAYDDDKDAAARTSALMGRFLSLTDVFSTQVCPTFPVTAHLKAAEEGVEFAEEPSLEEASDLLACVFIWALRTGHTPSELLETAVAKMEVNTYERTWSMSANGTWKHVKEAPDA